MNACQNQAAAGASAEGAAPPVPGSLDTLAQLGTDSDFAVNPVTSASDQKPLFKRARAKFLGSAIVLRLVDLPSPLRKAYWNSYHCSSSLQEQNGRVLGKFCKNRWCLVCNRIRTARLINSYRPTLSTWTDRHFLTLTLPNVSAELLPATVQEMHQEFKRITEMLKKQHQRNRSHKIAGLRKFECTYNADRDDYHPHFHVICRDYASASRILEEWLRRYPAAVGVAQDLRPADDGDCIELFKYFTKLLGKNSKNNRLPISPEALDTIFRSIIGVRTFQGFGFKLPKEVEVIPDDSIPLDVLADQEHENNGDSLESVYYIWQQQHSDWIGPNGECLSGYEVSDKMRDLVSNICITRKFKEEKQ